MDEAERPASAEPGVVDTNSRTYAAPIERVARGSRQRARCLNEARTKALVAGSMFFTVPTLSGRVLFVLVVLGTSVGASSML